MNAELLSQLENSLISYQENQETLDIVVQSAQRLFGDDWMKSLPTAFDDIEMPPQTRTVLRDKINHAIHYHSALLAWQEAYSYLNDSSKVTAEYLAERIPVLEYWLSLFGNEGAELTQKVITLYTEKLDAVEPEKEATEQSEVSTEAVETAQVENKPENVAPLPNEENSIEPGKEEIIEEKPLENDATANEVAPVEIPATNVAVESAVTNKTAENTDVVTEEPVIQAPAEQPPVSIEPSSTEQPPVSDDANVIVETKPENESENQIESVEETQQLPTEPQTKEISQQTWEDKNTAGEVPLEDWIDLENIPTASVPLPPEDEIRTHENDPQIVSQNWDIASYVKQKNLFDEANNWLSAWCVRMDNAEKTSYPYYGFIVDLMHDLKEKAQIVLENQLLEDLVERDILGGRVSIERTIQAIDKEFENLPDDFKTSTAEKIKLNAREILGAIDTSTEREEIEKAPDGFELMDDPYEASAQQIIDDFEKTEQEAQNKIDKLNVMEDNKQQPEKE